MKLPNGFGNVSKLSGNRRKPWRARKTNIYRWYDRKQMTYLDEIPDTSDIMEKLEDGKTFRYAYKQTFVIVGYYATRTEAIQALSDYNKDPYDLHMETITFAEVYDRWSEKKFEQVSKSNIQGYQASYKICDKIKDMRMVDIKLDHLQKVIDDSGKNYPTLKKLRILFSQLFDYAVIHEIITKDRNMVEYLDIQQYRDRNPNKYDRKPFTKKEVSTVWKWNDTNEHISIILMMIYTGVRVSELLDLKKENVNLEERYFEIIESKTEAGIRTVPIAEKIVPLFEYWMTKNDCEYVLSTPDNEHFLYRNFYDSYWKPLTQQMGLSHKPHDTRHTCVSMLTVAGVDERIIKKIVGHKGQGVTEQVYTHFEITELIEAINKI